MKIKTGMEQSIYILLILSRLPQESTLTSDAISARLNLSPSYLKKLMKVLVHEGLVVSSTGKKGGFSLAKPIKEITLYDIFETIEGKGSIFNGRDILSYFLDSNIAHQKKGCVIDIIMDTIEKKWKASLEEITLDSLMKQIEQQYDIKKIDHWIQESI